MNLSKDSPSGQGPGAGRAESVWARRHGSVDGLRPWGPLTWPQGPDALGPILGVCMSTPGSSRMKLTPCGSLNRGATGVPGLSPGVPPHVQIDLLDLSDFKPFLGLSVTGFSRITITPYRAESMLPSSLFPSPACLPE